MNSLLSISLEKRKNCPPDTGVSISLIASFLLLLISGFPLEASHAQTQRIAAQEQAASTTYITNRINELIQNSSVSSSVWAVSVQDSSGKVLADLNGNKLMRTASNSKLFTSAAVLNGLGPDFTFSTNLYGDGNLEGDVWKGDMHFLGSGDPSIDKHFYNDDALFVFNYFINQLKEKGIGRIEGDLFGNESFFDDIRYPRGWEWDDLSFYYAPEISALSFNRNCVDLIVRAVGSPGDTPQITWFPFNTDYVNFVNEQLITPRSVRYNESYARLLGTNTILLRSTLPVGYLEKESLTVSDPSLFFIDTFFKQASYRGIDWIGELITDQSERPWSSFELLASHESEPISELLKRVNQNSDNFYTEMLTKALAAYRYGAKGTTEGGIELIMEELEKLGLDTSGINMRDSSGMAGANLATAHHFTMLLNRMLRHENRSYWLSTLSRAGFDGTMQNRFITSPALGNVYAKSGFISGVRTLSGYVETRSGQKVSYSILTNNFTERVAAVDAVHEQIVNLLYQNL